MNIRLLATGCLLVAGTSAHARTGPAATPVGAGNDTANAPTRVLAPIRVNAFRLGQELLSTAAAVDVIGHDAIDRGRRKTQLNAALNRVPGVYANNGSNFVQNLRVSIRGFGARSAFGVRRSAFTGPARSTPTMPILRAWRRIPWSTRARARRYRPGRIT
ncbi:TonB-dependent receptor plug domain-containing protein [Salinisphaera sp. RV14]|uniref:TonB-dependent receptor plug domain-containing protein n=1 Tax=Salinisphaera sp. RV14 TaxID=3454140 RepID=UPI003F87274F